MVVLVIVVTVIVVIVIVVVIAVLLVYCLIRWPGAAIEARVQRLRLWQSVARDGAQRHNQLLSVILGQVMDEPAPFLEDGTPSPTCNPWAIQLYLDVMALDEFDSVDTVVDLIQGDLY